MLNPSLITRSAQANPNGPSAQTKWPVLFKPQEPLRQKEASGLLRLPPDWIQRTAKCHARSSRGPWFRSKNQKQKQKKKKKNHTALKHICGESNIPAEEQTVTLKLPECEGCMVAMETMSLFLGFVRCILKNVTLSAPDS